MKECEEIEKRLPKNANFPQLDWDLDASIPLDEIEIDESSPHLRKFDSEAIDESATLNTRITNIRRMFSEKIRRIQELEEFDNSSIARHLKLHQDKKTLLESVATSRQESLNITDYIRVMKEICQLSHQRIKLVEENQKKNLEASSQNVEQLAIKFKTTIDDIEFKLLESKESQRKQEEENNELRMKIDEFKSHSSVRSNHYATQLRAKSLELQLIEAKHEQQLKLTEQEKARNDAYKSHITQLHATKAELKAQLGLYSSKFEQFQDALTRSEEMFLQFQERMISMEDTISQLEKENSSLQEKCNTLDVNLIQTFDQRQKALAQLESERDKKARLEKKCRALQQAKKVAAANSAAQSTQSADDGGSNSSVTVQDNGSCHENLANIDNLS
jgi:chromosome segregation ATPase